MYRDLEQLMYFIHLDPCIFMKHILVVKYIKTQYISQLNYEANNWIAVSQC